MFTTPKIKKCRFDESGSLDSVFFHTYIFNKIWCQHGNTKTNKINAAECMMKWPISKCECSSSDVYIKVTVSDSPDMFTVVLGGGFQSELELFTTPDVYYST